MKIPPWTGRSSRRCRLRKDITATAAILLLICLSPPIARAGPPYNVDDPGTLDYRHVFLYTSYVGTLKSGTLTQTSPNLTLGYGVTPNLEADLGFASSTSNVPVPLPVTNFTDPAVAVKWRFHEESHSSPALALGYQLTMTTRNEGLGTGYFSHSMWLPVSKRVGRGLAWGYAGINIYPRPDLNSSVYYGAAYDYPLGSRWRVGAQFYGNAAASGVGINEEAAWGLGATYILTSRSTLLLQAGHSMKSNYDLNLYAGVVMRLNK